MKAASCCLRWTCIGQVSNVCQSCPLFRAALSSVASGFCGPDFHFWPHLVLQSVNWAGFPTHPGLCSSYPPMVTRGCLSSVGEKRTPLPWPWTPYWVDVAVDAKCSAGSLEFWDNRRDISVSKGTDCWACKPESAPTWYKERIRPASCPLTHTHPHTHTHTNESK